MRRKIEELYLFLEENRKYNFELQYQFFRSIIGLRERPIDRLISLLYRTVNTQSQPKIDYLSKFFEKIHSNAECLFSYQSFMVFLNSEEDGFCGLYNGIKQQKGWGPKTSALLTKNIYLLHNIYDDSSLKFWNDVPKIIQEEDKFYLPVDSVITQIFQKINDKKRWSFETINSFLHKEFRGDQIVVWDDLWFWGFFNQKVKGAKRLLEWNEAKYWALMETNKNAEVIQEIKEKSREFTIILES